MEVTMKEIIWYYNTEDDTLCINPSARLFKYHGCGASGSSIF
jgi:hypothetical protein